MKWRLISSRGMTWANPPPVAPPFIPNTGPREGSLKAAAAFFPKRFKASAKPIEVVVLPSPAGVGLMAVTIISLPLLPPLATTSGDIFALYLPYFSRVPTSIPNFSAISSIGLISTFFAISSSFGMLTSFNDCILLKRILQLKQKKEPEGKKCFRAKKNEWERKKRLGAEKNVSGREKIGRNINVTIVLIKQQA